MVPIYKVSYLRVEPHFSVRLSNDSQGLHEHVDAGGLSGSTGTQDHDAVPDTLCLVELESSL